MCRFIGNACYTLDTHVEDLSAEHGRWLSAQERQEEVWNDFYWTSGPFQYFYYQLINQGWMIFVYAGGGKNTTRPKVCGHQNTKLRWRKYSEIQKTTRIKLKGQSVSALKYSNKITYFRLDSNYWCIHVFITSQSWWRCFKHIMEIICCMSSLSSFIFLFKRYNMDDFFIKTAPVLTSSQQRSNQRNPRVSSFVKTFRRVRERDQTWREENCKTNMISSVSICV